MNTDDPKIEIVKRSGERTVFSTVHFENSIRRSGAEDDLIHEISTSIRQGLYSGISTKEIFTRTFSLLKKSEPIAASRYKLKQAIYELGAAGFPFKKFIAAILYENGFKVKTDQVLQGSCIAHKVDIVGHREDQFIIVACEFLMDESQKCDVKVPLYSHSRFRDIHDFYFRKAEEQAPDKGWVVTNSKFSKDAEDYGKCAGLYLLSWDTPENESLKDIIDRMGLYPITVSTLLTPREKQFLLSRDVVLCKQLINDEFYLDHLDVSWKRKEHILKEIKLLSIHTNEGKS